MKSQFILIFLIIFVIFLIEIEQILNFLIFLAAGINFVTKIWIRTMNSDQKSRLNDNSNPISNKKMAQCWSSRISLHPALARKFFLWHNFCPNEHNFFRPNRLKGGRNIRPFIVHRGTESRLIHSFYRWMNFFYVDF